MKKVFALLLTFVLLVSVIGCEKDTATTGEEKNILVGTWINVHDGDVYVFGSENKGTHDEKEITYSVDGQTLSITEGVSAATPKELKIVDENGLTKLVVDSTYYVKEENYAEIAEKVKQESIDILLSEEFWSSVNATAYLSFQESGGGYLLLVGNTLGISWEMVDNNTVKTEVLGQNQTMTLTVDLNDGKNYRLLDDEGKVSFIPKGN